MGELNKVDYIKHDKEYFNNTIHSKMRRVALSQSGEVVGIHHTNNTNLWQDGSKVDWSTYESKGWNCMVQIPKFYYKVEIGTLVSFNDVYRCEVIEKEKDGYKVHPAFNREEGIVEDYQYISAFEGWVDSSGRLRSLPNKTVTVNKTRAQFRSAAELNGSDYRQQDFYLISAVQMLFITEYGSLNSQVALGKGRTSGGSDPYIKTGVSLVCGNNSYGNKTANTDVVSYRGIENLWGNYWKFLDGLNISNYIPYVSKKKFKDDVFTGNYSRVGNFTLPSITNYITNFKKINGDFDFTFLPSSVGGTESTYFGDSLYVGSGDRIALFGGYSANTSGCGAFCISLSAASITASSITARLAYLIS
ncbi:hypothetical protein ACQKMD_16720 [Viridibacillus sp. NPDC096237]|uniref:hypothetical protein n=1 Tax=Viridibacillus sp. NPDC096237 TaxID=3390721 RepID=UPI003D07AAFC